MSSPLKIVATIYRMYERRGLDIPYFRTCMTVIGFLFLHVVVIGLLLKLPSSYIFPGINNVDSNATRYLKFLIVLGVLILLFSQFFNKKKLIGIEVTEFESRRAKKVVTIYFIALILLMTMLLIIKGIRMGLIK